MPLSDSLRRRKERLYSRGEIEDLIAQGRSIVIIGDAVLKVDAWLPYHPGGDKAVMHMVGRDATDEVNALHSREALIRMSSYQIGRIEGRWDNFLPPIQGGTFRTLNEQQDPYSEHVTTSLQVNKKASVAEDAEDNSSEESHTESPVFEPEDNPRTTLRYRSKKQTASASSSSATSLSEMDLDEEGKDGKLGHINPRTQEELDLDLAKYPPLDSKTQDAISQKYRVLYDKMRREGLFQCDYRAYAIECCRYLTLLATSLVLLKYEWYCLSAVFLGLFWHQLTFTAHDAGHMGITHNFIVDSCIGIFVADFCGGLSIGWWKRNHNVHHIVTNSPEHDPDIEHMPFFAISHRFFDSLRSTYYDRIMTYDAVARFTIRYQDYLYYPILLFGRVNLYRLSWEYLLLGLGPRKGPAAWLRWLEIVGQITFWTWFGYGLVYRCIPDGWNRFLFVVISHFVTTPVHVQITLSHFAMSSSDLGVNESFPQKMLRTTMDVDCPEWLDFVHGGLQFQAIHHLYPRMPRHNLRKAQRLIQNFCEETAIPYALYGFVDGNKQVIGRLADVSRQAAILAKCQQSIVQKPDFEMHVTPGSTGP